VQFGEISYLSSSGTVLIVRFMYERIVLCSYDGAVVGAENLNGKEVVSNDLCLPLMCPVNLFYLASGYSMIFLQYFRIHGCALISR
jgi:hypothetical protein